MTAPAEPAPEPATAPASQPERAPSAVVAPATRLPWALVEVARQAWGRAAADAGSETEEGYPHKSEQGAGWDVPFQDLLFRAGESCDDGPLAAADGTEEEDPLGGEWTNGGREEGTASWEAALRLLVPVARQHWMEAAPPQAAALVTGEGMASDRLNANGLAGVGMTGDVAACDPQPRSVAEFGVPSVSMPRTGIRGWGAASPALHGWQQTMSGMVGEPKSGPEQGLGERAGEQAVERTKVEAASGETVLPWGRTEGRPAGEEGEGETRGDSAGAFGGEGGAKESTLAAVEPHGHHEGGGPQAAPAPRNETRRPGELDEAVSQARPELPHVAEIPRAEAGAQEEMKPGDEPGRVAPLPVQGEPVQPGPLRSGKPDQPAAGSAPHAAATAAAERTESREPHEGQDGGKQRSAQPQAVEKHGRAGSAPRDKELRPVEPEQAPAARLEQGHRAAMVAHEAPAAAEIRRGQAAAAEPFSITDRMQVRDITPPATPQAPRTLQVQVTGAGGEDVQATISATAAGVQVRLRAAESGLSQAIEQGAPVLRERLEEIQSARMAEPWDAAAWGGEAVGGLHAAGESSLQQGAGGESQGRDPGSPGEGERRQGEPGGERRQRDAEADAEEFEAYFQAGGTR